MVKPTHLANSTSKNIQSV